MTLLLLLSLPPAGRGPTFGALLQHVVAAISDPELPVRIDASVSGERQARLCSFCGACGCICGWVGGRGARREEQRGLHVTACSADAPHGPHSPPPLPTHAHT